MLRVEMLCTGDEVLHGQIVDTNAAWLANYLFEQGLPMSARMTVGDNLSALVAALTERSLRADILIVNGGLGPTSDDLSALAASTAAGEELVEHPEWLAKIEAYFAERGRVMAPSNRKQALIPANAEMIDNPVGTACGFALQLNRCLMFFTPGVPSEFKVMVAQEIVPRLRERFDLPDPPLCLRLTTFGRAESELASQLDGMPLPEEVVLGYRSSMPIIELKLTGPAHEREAMELAWQQVRAVAGESAIYEGTDDLPTQLAGRLRQLGLTLAIGEHFTAGLLTWQCQSAGMPVVSGEWLSSLGADSADKSADRNPAGARQSSAEEASPLQKLARQAQDLAARHGAQLALAVGNLEQERLSLALHTPDRSYAQTVTFTINIQRHGLKTRQEVVSLMALNMLRRWLNGWPVYADHGWIRTTDTLA
ncbi:nicotinamide mononucleotide deamidase-related protein YfaY [Sodalis ligni]|jgi:competence/damage-inducible protein CinA-like protein|uniref:nicotinamide mononucleotide deamidase-related protein YfaY n=1 Tax=Sodalis TaxID=84565 RepID=UPI00193F1FA0|nr:nicotinamide mononucleotide deamidase-related protein YfaY [Sodalis ligni]QWA09442.1 nicotinamide mononucleotide deamidase-related protein YfaY [Sodalis ligni]